MKRKLSVSALLLAWLLLASVALSADKRVGADCTCKGFKLYGKVQYVGSFPDLKIKAVSAFPDLKVQTVSAFPDKCGKWQVVDAFPDIKIQFVDAFEDVKVQFVDAFPGLP